jgi:hypothetical protein
LPLTVASKWHARGDRPKGHDATRCGAETKLQQRSKTATNNEHDNEPPEQEQKQKHKQSALGCGPSKITTLPRSVRSRMADIMRRQPPDPHPQHRLRTSKIRNAQTRLQFVSYRALWLYAQSVQDHGLSLAMGLTLGSGLACRPGELTSVTIIVRAELPTG